MKRLPLLATLTFALIIFSNCDISDSSSSIETPEIYEFTRNGESTVSFSGQTTRLKMATELVQSIHDFDNSTSELLLQMFRNEGLNGEDVAPFNNEELNTSSKSIKSKVAASRDYFSAKTAVSAEIRSDFESWLTQVVEEVYPNKNTLAEPGVSGQIADGNSVRYVNAQGFEYDQLVTKGLIGALMVDQMLNNYLSTSILDEGTNREDNDSEVLVEGKNYTTMEHKWDEAYGYLFGNSANPESPMATLGSDDVFLNKYFGRLDNDPDFEGIAQEVFDAFALGRAAIVAGDYELRNEQAAIIRSHISTVIGVRAVYYLNAGKEGLSNSSPDYGAIFHNLSEGYGFIYSLMFVRNPRSNEQVFTKAEIDSLLANLTQGDGLWEVSPATLDDMISNISAKFDFNLEHAINSN